MGRTLHQWPSVILAVLVTALSGALQPLPARAGMGADLTFDAAHGEVARVSAAIDSVTGDLPIAGTWGFWGNFQNHTAAPVPNAIVGFDSAYSPSGFTTRAGQPVSAFPTTISATSVAPGTGVFLGMDSPIPVTGAPGFDSRRAVDVLEVPVGGLTQTTTVAVTLTDPLYATTGHYLKLALYATVPGTELVSMTPPASVGTVDTVHTFGETSSWQFVMSGGVPAHTYVFSVRLHIPNPFGVPFVHKPQVNVLSVLEGPTICPACGPQSSVSVAEPRLDGPAPGSGASFASVSGAFIWNTRTEQTFQVQYRGSGTPPPMPDPAVCGTLPDCPVTGPTAVADGFTGPNSIATDRHGAIYVSERASASLATLRILRANDANDPGDPGADSGDEDAVSDSPHDSTAGAAASGPRARVIYRASARDGFTDIEIGSVQFDRRGNIYALVSEREVGSFVSVHRFIVRLARGSYRPRVLFDFTGLDPALGAPASAGFAVADDGTVFFGRYNSLLRIGHDGLPTVIATFGGATTRISTAPVIETDGSLAVGVITGPLGEVYSVRADGPHLMAHLLAAGPGVTSFAGYLKSDAAGNLYTLQRIPHAFQRFSCAFSTTLRVLRLDGGAVRTGIGETEAVEVASVTQGSHLLLRGADDAFFRVSPAGDVFFAVYPAVPSCPPAPFPSYPLSNQVRVRRVLAFLAQPDGTLLPEVLMQRGILPPTALAPGFAFALRERELLVSSGLEGDIVSFRY